MKIFGINGHPDMTDAYNNSPGGENKGVPYDRQIELVKSMGAGWYRTSFIVGDDGTLSDYREGHLFNEGPIEHSAFVPQCKEAGLQVLPVIHDRLYNSKDTVSLLWKASDQEVFDAGFKLGAGFAGTYGYWFTHFELGNEFELFRNLKVKDTLGTRPEHYISLRHLQVVGHYVKGMDHGIKSVKPEAKTMFNTSGYSAWLLYEVVFDIAYGVDIVATHIYNDMLQGPVSSVIGPEYDFVGYLRNRYGRPVWITETGYRWDAEKTFMENEQSQVNWFNKAKEMGADALFWHELLNNPGSPKSLDERNFGLIWFRDYPNNKHEDPVLKQLGEQLIAQNTESPEESYQITGLNYKDGMFILKMKKI